MNWSFKMKKVITYCKIDIASGEVVEEESYWYMGKWALCMDGGGDDGDGGGPGSAPSPDFGEGIDTTGGFSSDSGGYGYEGSGVGVEGGSVSSAGYVTDARGDIVSGGGVGGLVTGGGTPDYSGGMDYSGHNFATFSTQAGRDSGIAPGGKALSTIDAIAGVPVSNVDFDTPDLAFGPSPPASTISELSSLETEPTSIDVTNAPVGFTTAPIESFTPPPPTPSTVAGGRAGPGATAGLSPLTGPPTAWEQAVQIAKNFGNFYGLMNPITGIFAAHDLAGYEDWGEHNTAYGYGYVGDDTWGDTTEGMGGDAPESYTDPSGNEYRLLPPTVTSTNVADLPAGGPPVARTYEQSDEYKGLLSNAMSKLTDIDLRNAMARSRAGAYKTALASAETQRLSALASRDVDYLQQNRSALDAARGTIPTRGVLRHPLP